MLVVDGAPVCATAGAAMTSANPTATRHVSSDFFICVFLLIGDGPPVGGLRISGGPLTGYCVLCEAGPENLTGVSRREAGRRDVVQDGPA